MTHNRRFCQFIPHNIIEKLPIDESEIELTKFFQEHRQFLMVNPELKKRRRVVTHKETRNLFDSANQYTFAEKPTLTEEQVHSSKPSTNLPLQLANKTYDFFHNKFNLESYDNENAPIDIHINFGQKYNNAFWDGKRMVFGTWRW